MNDALALREKPHQRTPCIHIAGTNGKGSTGRFIEAALSRLGFRTGLYTSPHLHRYAERFRIAEQSCKDSKVASKVVEILAARDAGELPALTFFEVSTLIAFELFHENKVEVAVLETGLGGRLDATNVVTPKVSVITQIGLDHCEYLGNTLAAIAGEKAGIIKTGTPVVLGPLDDEAMQVVVGKAQAMCAPLFRYGTEFDAQEDENGIVFNIMGRKHRTPRLQMPGDHQVHNAACALAAIHLYRQEHSQDLDSEISRAGASIAGASVPCRLERIKGHEKILIDGAHNPQGCRALASYLSKNHQPCPRVLVFAHMTDKDGASMLDILAPHFDHVVSTSTQMARSANPLPPTANTTPSEHIGEAIDKARAIAGDSGSVVVAGSLFLAALARGYLLGLPQDPTIAL